MLILVYELVEENLDLRNKDIYNQKKRKSASAMKTFILNPVESLKVGQKMYPCDR